MRATSPLLARREIPARERWQKALVVLLLTAALVSGAWWYFGASIDSDIRVLLPLAAIAVLGLGMSGYFAFHRYEDADSKEGKAAIRQRIADDRSGAGWTARIGFNLRRFVFGIVYLAGLLIAFAGILVLCYQGILFLKTGEWLSLSVFTVLAPYAPWLRDPQSWIGLYRLTRDALGLLPVSLALVVLGWLIAGFGSGLRQAVRRR